MLDPRQFVMNLISQNPAIANNPQAQEYLRVIQSGDAQRGQEIANNLCQSYGVSPQDAVAQARRFFNLPF